VQEALKLGLSRDQLLSEQALRYSRSKLGTKNPMKGLFAERHPNFKGDLTCDPDGYVLVLRPTWFTGRTSRYVYKHSVVMCELLGLQGLPEGMHVHHIDGDKANNSAENLALVTASGHRRLHAQSPLRRLSLWELHRCGTSRLRPTIPTSPTV
jgi:hypothetical protein